MACHGHPALLAAPGTSASASSRCASDSKGCGAAVQLLSSGRSSAAAALAAGLAVPRQSRDRWSSVSCGDINNRL
jgi:hypothetical protein